MAFEAPNSTLPLHASLAVTSHYSGTTKVSSVPFWCRSRWLIIVIRRHGWPSDAPFLLEVVPSDRHRQPAPRLDSLACFERSRHHCRWLHAWLLLRRGCNHLAGQRVRPEANHLYRLVHHDRWSYSTMHIIQSWTADCSTAYHWLWEWYAMPIPMLHPDAVFELKDRRHEHFDSTDMAV